MTCKALLVDGNNALVRAVHAFARSGLTAPDGTRTGPLLGFINTLSRHVIEEQPDRVVVCWDTDSQWRKGLQPDYKGNRTRSDPSIARSRVSSGNLARRFLMLAGIPQDVQDGCEADDLIATYVRNIAMQPAEDDWHTVILSSDKDFLMLLDDRPGHRVEQVRLSSADTPTDRWDADTVRSQRGCEPYQLPYLMALSGDKADNVIGVPGVGMKRAAKIMQRHGWDFASALDDPKVGAYAGQVRNNLSLVDLTRRHDSDVTDHALPPRPWWEGSVGLRPFLQRLGMVSTLRKLDTHTLWGAASAKEGTPHHADRL